MIDFLPCFIIPNYNHHLVIEKIVSELSQYDITIIIVNDGSNAATRELLISITERSAIVELIHLKKNQGKGAAVIAGLSYALEKGYSHGFQIDADGQHNLSNIPHFLEISKDNPEKVICGHPIYDKSVPFGRLLSRFITHFWVWVETLSFQIKDSMCGFRIYPLEPTCKIIQNKNIGHRMDFDIEILVRLYWQKNVLLFLPISVIYPEQGISHFRVLQDNWLITKMHTRLFFEMLKRIPGLLKYNQQRKKTSKEIRWGRGEKDGNILGLKILVGSYKIFGKNIILILLHPAIAFYLLVSRAPYNASRQYLQQLFSFSGKKETVGWKQVYDHFYEFGVSAIDEISSYMGNFPESEIIIHSNDIFDKLLHEKKGAIFIGSHLGNIELSRAMSIKHRTNKKLNALVNTRHALNFQNMLSESTPNTNINLIDISDFGIDTTLLLQQKIEQGEIIIIVGDRTSVNNSSRVHSINFLGIDAPFSEGPFILASILDCPVYLLFCHKETGLYNIYLEKFADSLKFPRALRKQLLAEKVQLYANRLAYHCQKAPYQWFNFYDFWKDESTGKTNTQ